MADFETLNSLISISSKISMTEKFFDFHGVEITGIHSHAFLAKIS